MTSRSVLGGNKQLIGSHSRADTQPVFKFHTYASAAFEPEAVMGASPLTPIADAIGNFLLVAGAVVLVCSVAISIPLAVFLMLFASF